MAKLFSYITIYTQINLFIIRVLCSCFRPSHFLPCIFLPVLIVCPALISSAWVLLPYIAVSTYSLQFAVSLCHFIFSASGPSLAVDDGFAAQTYSF